MCKPIAVSVYKDRDVLSALGSEIISGMSALNMIADPYPQRKVNRIIKQGYIPYLSLTDRWAEHSMKHLRHCMKLVRRLERIKHKQEIREFKRKERAWKRRKSNAIST